jgi:hypothetical protein
MLDCTTEPEPCEPTTETLNQQNGNALAIDDERFTSLNLGKKQPLELIKKLRTELTPPQSAFYPFYVVRSEI